MGQRLSPAVLPDGRPRRGKHQVAEVCVPLSAVNEWCDDGNIVAFTKHGGIIVDEKTGHATYVPREGGIYVVTQWVPPPEQADTVLVPSPGFARRG